MARRRIWRNDVVRSYWRTRHPLLRFLCLHEAVTLPFVVAISDPTYLFCDHPSALRRLPQWNFVLLAVKCHGVSPLSTAVRAIHRTLWPAQISKLYVWGLRMQFLWFECHLWESPSHNPPLSAWGVWKGVIHFLSPPRSGGLRGFAWICGLSCFRDLGFGCLARGEGEWADRPRLSLPH